MKSVIKNEFIDINYSVIGNMISMVWTPCNNYMSEWEFVEQIDSLFSTIEVFKSKIAYIDASSFCYPISEKSVLLIKQYISKCEVKSFGIVMSSNLLGKCHILRMLKKMSSDGCTLTIFHTRKEGEFWYSLKNGSVDF